MKKNIMILLPEKISILRNNKNQDIAFDQAEYNIYFENIIYPYSVDYDIQIVCDYGKNLGNRWRLDSFPENAGVFDFELRIYGDYGELLAAKSCKMEVFEKESVETDEKSTLLCVGDSMTRSEVYIQQVADRIRNIKTTGLRNIAYQVNHEGRGGWAIYRYFENRYDTGDGLCSGVSPFLFPKGYSGKEYFGSKLFWERVNSGEYSTSYAYAGFKPQQIKEGMVCCEDGKLYRYQDGAYVLETENPEFELSFSKYVERYLEKAPDIVSVLFGANELQNCTYEKAEEEVAKLVKTLETFVASVRACSADIKIIVNLPVLGGDQYSWGMQLGCGGSVKQYDYCIKRAGEALLKAFDGRRSENIYISPMLAVCDPSYGFPDADVRVNLYADRKERRLANWVHPSEVGYKQMGDALAGVIAEIRERG